MTRLRQAIREARQKFQPLYDNRKVLLDALRDPCHKTAEVDTLDRRPHNPLDRMLRILTRGVVDQNPTLRIVRSRQPRIAGMLKSQLERWALGIGMARRLQDIFQEALLRWGIAYTGYETPQDGHGMEPFVDVLDFDDYFIDQRGNDETEIDFEGHCWATRLYQLRQNPAYDQAVVDQIEESSRRRYQNNLTTLYDWVDLRCVWLPQEGIELTITDERSQLHPPLRVRRFDGPPPGPYVRLSLGDVRGTMIPVSRMSMLYDLHEFVVRAYRQVYSQADRSLEFYGYSGESEKDAEKHRTAMDGEYIRFDNPAGVVLFKKGGVDPQTLGAAFHADKLFDEDAGNLKLLGGLGPSAPTWGQERGLSAGVRQMVDEFRQRVDKVTKRFYEIAAWYMMRDPLRQGMVEWTTPRGNTVQSRWNPAPAMEPRDPEMDIIPGSMISRSAEAQLQSLIESFQVIASSMVLPGRKATTFDHRRFRELVAEYRNQPEIEELFGEAPEPKAIVPGVQAAGQFAQRPARPVGSSARPQPDKLVERMIFSGAQPRQ